MTGPQRALALNVCSQFSARHVHRRDSQCPLHVNSNRSNRRHRLASHPREGKYFLFQSQRLGCHPAVARPASKRSLDRAWKPLSCSVNCADRSITVVANFGSSGALGVDPETEWPCSRGDQRLGDVGSPRVRQDQERSKRNRPSLKMYPHPYEATWAAALRSGQISPRNFARIGLAPSTISQAMAARAPSPSLRSRQLITFR